MRERKRERKSKRMIRGFRRRVYRIETVRGLRQY